MKHQNNPYRRFPATRSVRKILIVCEGGKTEKYYFDAFKTNTDLVEVEVLGTGRAKDSLVNYAKQLKEKAELRKDPYKDVWCIFDRDTYPIDTKDKHKFNRAIQLAKNNQIRPAYSNDAFEIWYILHFNYHQAAWPRGMYEKKLSELLGMKYEKNDPEMYERLKDKQSTAIKHAEKLLSSYNNHNPESDNPCTTVHKLVIDLNQYLEDDEE